MLFNSLTFVVFYLVVFTLYWLLRARTPQNLLLLGASWIFYGAWSWKFLLLLLGSTVQAQIFRPEHFVDERGGTRNEKQQQNEHKRLRGNLRRT